MSGGRQARIVERLVRSARARAGGATVLEVRVGMFWTAVRTTAGTGMASSLRNEPHRHGDLPVRWAGALSGRPVAELAALLGSDSFAESVVALAAINAVLGPAAASLPRVNAVEIIRREGRGRRVAVLGHFPFVDHLEAECGELLVFERGLGLREGDIPVERLPERLPGAEVVAVTATSLLNGTLGDVLDLVSPEAFTVMLGPSTPLDAVLLEEGFDMLCGTVVEDPEAVLRVAGEGGVTRQIPGVRRVCLGPPSR